MWPFTQKPLAQSAAPIFLTNTLTGKKDMFVAQRPHTATLYSCGPTVYSRQHIGNMRAVVFADTLARVLMQAGYRVRRVINITDVGHLVGDAEEGEDKMAVGAKRENLTPEEIARRYEKLFLEDIQALGVHTDDLLFPRATEYMDEQIAMIRTLESKGYAYRTKDGVYFDTGKLPEYGKLGGVAAVKLMGGARVKVGDGKRNLHDFALWRAAKPGDLQQWNSPWGFGNPGWHIECSAMVKALLGDTIDIHTGGMDHIPVHHNNEIAQSETANGRPLARYWVHEAFLTLDGEKISKSLNNDIYLSDISEHGFHPLALRYLFLQAHYRTPISFTWDALAASAEALKRLWRAADDIARESTRIAAPSEAQSRFVALVRDDLATPAALALLWEVIKDEELSPRAKWGVIETADTVFGLSLLTSPLPDRQKVLSEMPQDIQELARQRDTARHAKNFIKADQLRKQIQERGYRVDDSPHGPVFTPR